MKPLFLNIALFILYSIAYGQKPLIQDTSYRAWTTVERGAISDDGNYVYYRINNEPRGAFTYVVKATSGNWEKRLLNPQNLMFSANSRLLFAMQKDTLVQITMGTDKVSKTAGYSSYRLLDVGNTQWLITESKDREKVFSVQNLKTGKMQVHKNKQQLITNGNSDLVVWIEYGPTNTVNLLRGNLNSGTYTKIYTGEAPANFIFDGTGSKFAFTDSPDQITHVFFSDGKSDQAQELFNENSAGLLSQHKISFGESWSFSKDGNNLFFSQLKQRTEKKKEAGDPDIWRHDDTYLLSRYRALGGLDIYKGENLSTYNISTKKIKQLLSGNQRVISGLGDRVAVVRSVIGDMAEGDFENVKPSYYLCFYETGEVRPIKINCRDYINFHISPDEKYLVYYDRDFKSYRVHSIVTGETISFNPDASKISKSDFQLKNVSSPATVAGWIKNTNRIILQDKYDLWEIDVEHNTPPRCLTNGFGEKEKIAFSFAKGYPNRQYPMDEPIALLAFNLFSKTSAIYTLKIKENRLQCLFKSNIYLGSPYVYTPYFAKAKHAEKYFWRIETAEHSPNYFYSKGTGTPIDVSNLYPEKKFNWIKSEIANYKDKTGFNCQSIIYKPENFDSTKKYPVIFFYYRAMSNELNKYLSPEPSSIGINIPLLVSNGYIVVKPDIYLKMGEPGISAMEPVMTAADYFGKLNWVDSTKMGITGHSLGGYETNYIITRTNRFSAACTEAGMTNMIQHYNNIWEEGNSVNAYSRGVIGFEYGLDSVPNRYIDNSPIFKVKDIQTPLLIMHNKEDFNVPESHGLQMFVQMKSLKKPVWLLQYDKETHTIDNLPNQLDFQRRFKDFFDYYLKGYPKPDWMKPLID